MARFTGPRSRQESTRKEKSYGSVRRKGGQRLGVAINPVLSVKSPTAKKKESQVLNEVQTAKLLRAAEGTELYAPLYVDAYTGLRRGELLALCWDDVSFHAKTLYVRRTLSTPKNGVRYGEPKSEKSKRTIHISESVVDVLRQHRKTQLEQKVLKGPEYQDNGLVFCRADGTPWEPGRFSTSFREFEDGLDLPRIRLHDLRHGHCSHLLRAGQSLKLVSERLGHSSIAITADTYAHVLTGQDEAAADVIDQVMKAAFSQVS